MANLSDQGRENGDYEDLLAANKIDFDKIREQKIKERQEREAQEQREKREEDLLRKQRDEEERELEEAAALEFENENRMEGEDDNQGMIEIDDGDMIGEGKNQFIENLNIDVPAEDEGQQNIEVDQYDQERDSDQKSADFGGQNEEGAVMMDDEEDKEMAQYEDIDGEEEFPAELIKCLQEVPILEDNTEAALEEFQQQLFKHIVNYQIFSAEEFDLLFQATCDANEGVDPELLNSLFEEVASIIQQQLEQAQEGYEGEDFDDEDN